MSRSRNSVLFAALLLLFAPPLRAQSPDAAALIKAAIEYWRDVSSYSVADMVIHRPDWQRSVTFRVWTRG
ncbi:MAG: outer membrane lipoprotein-sorting protein, partial [Pseudomonadota bacterium]